MRSGARRRANTLGRIAQQSSGPGRPHQGLRQRLRPSAGTATSSRWTRSTRRSRRSAATSSLGDLLRHRRLPPARARAGQPAGEPDPKHDRRGRLHRRRRGPLQLDEQEDGRLAGAGAREDPPHLPGRVRHLQQAGQPAECRHAARVQPLEALLAEHRGRAVHGDDLLAGDQPRRAGRAGRVGRVGRDGHPPAPAEDRRDRQGRPRARAARGRVAVEAERRPAA